MFDFFSPVKRINFYYVSTSRYCNKIFTYGKKIKNFPNDKQYKNFVINPLIRRDIFLSKNLFKKKKKIFSILIIGGSQGAKKFDDLFNKDLIELSRKYKIKIFHQTRKKNIEIIKKLYHSKKLKFHVFSYTNQLYKIINQCDLAITRSGASTVNELLFLEIPFLAIPFPFAKDDHQFFNAKYYQKKNGCWLIRQNDFDLIKIENLIINIFIEKVDYFNKKENLEKISNQNTWNNVNKKLTGLINEN